MSQDEVSVASIMRKKVPVVAPDDTVQTVATMMARSDVPGVLVVENGDLLGIITESDIVTRKAEVDVPKPSRSLAATSRLASSGCHGTAKRTMTPATSIMRFGACWQRLRAN
ncbi:MAG: CBS domain-containing protein [Thermomicrobiales bacterium]